MMSVLLVAIGGATGSVARFALGGWLGTTAAGWRFPISTFLVNVVGCLIIGGLAGIGERPGLLSYEARLFLFTGMLGGFTTFSAFGLETLTLVRRGDMIVAGTYVGLSVLVGLLAVAGGFALAANATR